MTQSIVSTKTPAKESLLTPRFYTTDFDEMANLDISLNIEEIKAILSENQPTIAPSKPGTKEKEETETKPPKRRSLTPPEESPNTKPKALMKEEEKELVKKIAQRFKKLNNG
jgi:hypothetical protein